MKCLKLMRYMLKGMLASLLFLLMMVSGLSDVAIKADTDVVSAPNAVNATYKWASNSVDTGSSAASVYVLKSKTGNTIKAGTSSKAITEKSAGASTYCVSMVDLGIKKTDKEVYLYVCDKDFETEGQNISANLVIKASEAKKVVGSINYAKDGMDWEFNVLSATATDASKNEIKNPDIYWSYEANGTYFAVNDDTDSATRKYNDKNKTIAPNGFDGLTLKDILDAGGGTIYIKTAGKDGGTGVAQFGSQATQVKIPKRAKAPSVKIDVKKTSISIKNGFDFTFVSKVNGEYSEPSAWEWFTVLPYLKTADVKSYEKSIIPEYYYMPLSKKNPNAGKVITVADEEEYYYSSYTAFKFKTIDLTYLLNNYGWLDDGKFYIAVRKSATEKKPASEIFYIEVKEQALSPLVYTKENVRWEYLVDTSTDFDKKGLTINTVIPYPGSIIYDDDTKEKRHRHIATEGYAETFKVVTSVSGGTIKWADTDGDAFEYAIVRGKDLEFYGRENSDSSKWIDWTSVGWKKFEPGKTKITGKLKTSYKLMDGTKVSEKLTADIADSEYEYSKYYILIRRAGNKSGNIIASDYEILYIEKDGKNYNLYSSYSTGDEAYRYTIKFVKYTKNADGSYGWNLADDVDDVSIWMASTAEKYVSLPEIAGAKLFNAYKNGTAYTVDTSASGAVVLEANGDNKGQYAISTENQKKVTEYLAIREYANITVKQVVSGDASKEIIIFQQKDGKVNYRNGEKVAASSGEATEYVGSVFDINVAIDAPSLDGYVLANGTLDASGFVTFATPSSGEATSATVSMGTINSTDEVEVIIPYTATALYEITVAKDPHYGGVYVQRKKGDGTWEYVKRDGEYTNMSGKTLVFPKGTIIRFTVERDNDSYKYKEVTFNGILGSLNEGYTKATSPEIVVDKSMTMDVEITVWETE